MSWDTIPNDVHRYIWKLRFESMISKSMPHIVDPNLYTAQNIYEIINLKEHLNLYNIHNYDTTILNFQNMYINKMYHANNLKSKHEVLTMLSYTNHLFSLFDIQL